MYTIKEYIKKPSLAFLAVVLRLAYFIPDKTYLKIVFRLMMGRRLNLKEPKTFNEKLQWLKLYNRNPVYSMMVDKYAVKDYITKTIGNEYVTPTIGIWDKTEDIDWNSLPNQFVLKTTHGGGSSGVIICKDKTVFDKHKAIEKLNLSLHQDIYRQYREFPYKDVPKRIIAECYIPHPNNMDDLPDYKFFCFDGEVKAILVATDRHKVGEEVKFDFFDSEYNYLPFRQGHNHANDIPPKPQSFVEMKQLASKLSRGIPHVRIDFYENNGRPLFGEITFFHFAGFVPFEPEKWDYTFGEWISLPEKRS